MSQNNQNIKTQYIKDKINDNSLLIINNTEIQYATKVTTFFG